MQYNDDAQLDTSEVQDTRGGGTGFGRVAAGGGGLGIVGLIVVVLMNVLGGGGSSGGLPGGIGGLSDVGQGSNASSVDNTQLSSECKTGADRPGVGDGGTAPGGRRGHAHPGRRAGHRREATWCSYLD